MKILIYAMAIVMCALTAKGQSKSNTMNTDKLTNTTVKKAIDALQSADSNGWFALFTADAALYDDGNKMNFRSFFEKALGHERFTSIDKVENNGLDLYGRFHSDQWGDFKTYFRFHIDATGKINRLDIGQASY
ncbi:hypothetical protein L3C95_00465 [Chitinophaga filiformis]|uniref:hypothetical protein n=1 Tax=Chitinophaga filiformis TaxID=104663 RepID=UPI001F234A3E|nr:hypothetical protein [Chitinophaga filiformis]MCF6401323.1 hypothetical protein [Chitinophaga filiformis]